MTDSAGAVQRRRRILVVDDAPDVRQIHTRFLHGSGMEVVTAENGTMALDVARRALPDVIVTDVNMPVMDGLNLCRQLRADATTRNVVVVVVTGDAPDQTQPRSTRGAMQSSGNPALGRSCWRRFGCCSSEADTDRPQAL